MAKMRDASQAIDENLFERKRSMLEQLVRNEQRKLEQVAAELENERNEKIRAIRLDTEKSIQEIQRQYKLAAVLIPPIPPLLLGLIVFTRRRLREREGISKSRRLK